MSRQQIAQRHQKLNGTTSAGVLKISHRVKVKDPDPVTRISKLDISDTLHLHPNDTTALTVVSIKLKGTENYQVLPDVRKCLATISSEESHRVAAGSIVGSSKGIRLLLLCLMQGGGLGLVCENYGFNGHTIDRCFKIIGYPVDFGKRKYNQSFKWKNISNNNYVGTSSSSGFKRKKCHSNSSLQQDNKMEKNVQANMAGANQHMTYTDKELDNVIDISHLRIKVGHPNGTEAYISKIGNLMLSNGLTMYDVMVIPEYCVTLISVYKLVKENKVIIAFDENMCYFLNQDLSLKNILGIGDQCEGLYYYNNQGIKSNNSTLRYQCLLSQHDWHCRLGHLAEPVLNVLKDSLQIDKKDNINEGFHLKENVFSKGNLDQKPSSSHGVQNIITSSRQSVFPKNYNDFVVESKVKYGLENYFKYSGEIDRYKARLVAQGFGQKEGIDYEETFSHVVKMVIVRCLLNIVVSMSWPVYKLDVNNAFLYGDLEEVVYMKPPEDYSLYTKSDKGVFLALLVYVDDIIITGNNVFEIEKFKVFLKSKFMIKDLGKLKYFLGIKVIDTDKGICLNQRKYVLDLLSEYGMLACKPAKTPLMSKLVIYEWTLVDKDPLHENFMHPLTYHYRIAFKILRYLKSCQGLGMHIAKTSGVGKTVKVDSAHQIADILTKGLDTIRHSELVKRLGMHDVYQVNSGYRISPLAHVNVAARQLVENTF
ncbi:ribonuclease H-like domain-containing protein [Tanacetum coccineum]